MPVAGEDRAPGIVQGYGLGAGDVGVAYVRAQHGAAAAAAVDGEREPD